MSRARAGSGEAWPTWESAWWRALYGPAGFYRRPEGPAGHFRTAAHAAAPELAAALHRLALELGCTAIVDVGAGRGELLTALAADAPDVDPAGGPPVDGDRLRLFGVDVVPRPARLPAAVGWVAGMVGGTGPPAEALGGALGGALVIGWELLDVVPGAVLELDGDGVPRVVLVEPPTGRERLGAPAGPADRDWCERWWPVAGRDEGDRLEVGRPRDEFWAGLARQARAAGARALLAVDYAHELDHRPAAGSLAGFRNGRAVPPRPDGSMDVTAHVAIDAVAAAVRAAGAGDVTLTRQHTALAALGVRQRELLDPGGLGGFSWLLARLDP